MTNSTLHKFHIPVMGLAYTIDSPLKVAQFGIASVISIIEDRLIELMRRYYYQQLEETYEPISDKEENYRSRRITDYLNLVNRTVKQQVEQLKQAAFEAGSNVVKYFEMLPDDHALKQLYQKMTITQDATEKATMQAYLRSQIVPGSIDVNIMTKVDKNNYDKDGMVIDEGSDALVSLRAYAESELENSSIVFSAGMNPRLYNYLEKWDVFRAKGLGVFEKKIVIKVSDFRSALIQGKYLAKKGLWVSEFRIESGLNCGGHAFASDGYLLGPIMEEFKTRREELITTLFELYNKSLQAKGDVVYDTPHPLKITVQGGVGNASEQDFLTRFYEADSVGWGTPFLLVPEATTVDAQTLELLCQAEEDDVILSHHSPLGVRFNYLKGASGEMEKLDRIQRGIAGSACPQKYLVSNTEFTEKPICTASLEYQRVKQTQLDQLDLPEAERKKLIAAMQDKECLCIGLSNAANHKYGLPLIKKLQGVTICPGPNIAYFTKTSTLQEMTDHIYGRNNLLEGVDRPDLFVKELQLYVSYFKEMLGEAVAGRSDKKPKYFQEFYNNLLTGVAYYEGIMEELAEFSDSMKRAMQNGMQKATAELEQLWKAHQLVMA
jgi:hypothetical protein